MALFDVAPPGSLYRCGGKCQPALRSGENDDRGSEASVLLDREAESAAKSTAQRAEGGAAGGRQEVSTR